VAGVASLIWSSNPTLKSEQVERMLLQSTRDINVAGIDQLTGYGLLDAAAALKADPNFYVNAEISGVEVIPDGSTQALQVKGTAIADQIKGYRIEIGAGENPSQWKRVVDAPAQSIRESVLGKIPASEFTGSAVWVIRLVAEHQNGKSREARFDLRLE
jgi:hypothetical protein